MFPSAVTALTGAGRSRSPERARAGSALASESAREEREASGKEGAERPVACGVGREGGTGEAAPGVRGSAEGAESVRATPSPEGKARA